MDTEQNTDTEELDVSRPWYRRKKPLMIAGAIGALALLGGIAIPLVASNAAEHRVATANELLSQIAVTETDIAEQQCQAQYEEDLAVFFHQALLPELEDINFFVGDGRTAIPKDERETGLEQLREVRTTLQEEGPDEAALESAYDDLEQLETARADCEPEAEAPSAVTEATDEDIAALQEQLDQLQSESIEAAPWVAVVNDAFAGTAETVMEGIDVTRTPAWVEDRHEHAGDSFYEANANDYESLLEAFETLQADEATPAETATALRAWRKYVTGVGKTIEDSKEQESNGGGVNDPVQQNPSDPNNPNPPSNNNNGGNNNPPPSNNNGGNNNPPPSNNNPPSDDGGGGNNNPPPTTPPKPSAAEACLAIVGGGYYGVPRGAPGPAGYTNTHSWVGGTYQGHYYECDRWAPASDPGDDW